MSQKIQEERNPTPKFSIKSAWNSVFEDINNDVLLSGKPLDTLVFLERLRKSIIISAIVLAPVSIFLYVIFSPIFLALNLGLVLIFAYPKIQQSSLSNARKKKVEEDKRATQLIMDKSKMLTLEQQALNSSMNRHFIFNALNWTD